MMLIPKPRTSILDAFTGPRQDDKSWTSPVLTLQMPAWRLPSTNGRKISSLNSFLPGTSESDLIWNMVCEDITKDWIEILLRLWWTLKPTKRTMQKKDYTKKYKNSCKIFHCGFCFIMYHLLCRTVRCVFSTHLFSHSVWDIIWYLLTPFFFR